MLTFTSLFVLPFQASAEVSSVEEKITETAKEMGVNPQLAVAIARCESKLDQGVKNKNSSASGIYQIIKETWQGTLLKMELPSTLDVFDSGSNILAGLWLLKNEGTSPWKASKDCWSKFA